MINILVRFFSKLVNENLVDQVSSKVRLGLV